jgi:phosphopantetheine adenylyltransferase
MTLWESIHVELNMAKPKVIILWTKRKIEHAYQMDNRERAEQFTHHLSKIKGVKNARIVIAEPIQNEHARLLVLALQPYWKFEREKMIELMTH